MKFFSFTAIVLSVLASDDVQRNVQAKTDRDKLQGDWRAVKIQDFGVDLLLKPNSGAVFSFMGDRVIRDKQKDDNWQDFFKLDPTKRPKSIDFMITQGEWKGRTVLGIYCFEGNALKVCFNWPPGASRPTEFKTSADSNILVIFERIRR